MMALYSELQKVGIWAWDDFSNSSRLTVDSKKLEYGPGMIYAGLPSS